MSEVTLESLFDEAVAAAKAARKSPPPPVPEWTPARGIALIHKETQTLLGQFREYIHREGWRKLVRSQTPLQVDATEELSGSWWVREPEKLQPRRDWHERRPVILHLHLDAMRLRAPAAELVAHLSYGGVARLELAQNTIFASDDAKLEQFVFMPAGTNVYDHCSLDTKIALKAELGSLG